MTTYDLPSAMVSVDLDRDHREDLVGNHDGWDKVGYYLRDGNELLPEALSGIVANDVMNPQALSAGDINGDGCTDIAVASNSLGLSILKGQNCFPPRQTPRVTCGLTKPAAGLSVASLPATGGRSAATRTRQGVPLANQ